MRGPGLRVSIDVRRLWRCPRCGYERKVPATETAVRCQCSAERPWMKLVEALRPSRPTPAPLDSYLNWEDFPESADDVVTPSSSPSNVPTAAPPEIVHEIATAPEPANQQPEAETDEISNSPSSVSNSQPARSEQLQSRATSATDPDASSQRPAADGGLDQRRAKGKRRSGKRRSNRDSRPRDAQPAPLPRASETPPPPSAEKAPHDDA